MPHDPMPRIDFGSIPEEFEGQWVVVRLGDPQVILGHGLTAREAVAMSGVDPEDNTVVLTGVPKPVPLVYMKWNGTEWISTTPSSEG